MAEVVDREPDFEDDKIRMWKTNFEQQGQADSTDDETVLPVDLVKEEVFESRVYPLRSHPETLMLIAIRRPDIATGVGSPEEFLDAVRPIIEEASLKILTKRSRSDGRITYLLSLVGPAMRTLLERGELPDEASYRRFVTDLEDELFVAGVVGEPVVTPLEQWRRYELQGES